MYSRDEAVAVIASSLLIFAAIFQIPDAIGFSAIGSLRGHKDTFATMVIMIISYWFFAMPVGVYLAFNKTFGLPTEAWGIWLGMILGISLSAILNLLRLKYKKTKLKTI